MNEDEQTVDWADMQRCADLAAKLEKHHENMRLAVRAGMLPRPGAGPVQLCPECGEEIMVT